MQAVIVQAAKSAMTSGLGNEKWTIRFNHTGRGAHVRLDWVEGMHVLCFACRAHDIAMPLHYWAGGGV